MISSDCVAAVAPSLDAASISVRLGLAAKFIGVRWGLETSASANKLTCYVAPTRDIASPKKVVSDILEALR